MSLLARQNEAQHARLLADWQGQEDFRKEQLDRFPGGQLGLPPYSPPPTLHESTEVFLDKVYKWMDERFDL